MANPFEYFLDLKLFRNSLLCLSIGICALGLADSLWVYYKKPPGVRQNDPSFFQQAKENNLQEPLHSYEAVFDKDSLFGKVSKETGSMIMKPITDLVKDLRLKGMVLIGEPEAIVEDARTQKTSFVKEGNMIGDLKVKTIEEGKLVLEYVNEEISLEIQ